MKKITTMLLALALPCCFLAGCSSTEKAAPKKSDTITLYFVRHGKTMFNNTDQVQGWSDTPLIEKGEQQADATGVGLKDITFTTAFTSDLGRARSTANRILAKNTADTPSLKELVGLREWGYGGYEGKLNAEMWDPIFEAHRLTFDAEWSQYGLLLEQMSDEDIANAIAENDPTKTAETYAEITKRSKEAVDIIVKDTQESGGGNALIVSSGSEIPTILELIAPGQYKGEDIANCSVTMVEYKDGNYTIKSIGDKSYTEKGLKE